MKILGISNPSFTGVTVATKAICTDYYPVLPITDIKNSYSLAKAIVNFKPDLLIVGGWSAGYNYLLEAMRVSRKFPVVVVQHSHVFHGSFFGDDIYLPEIDACAGIGSIDVIAYVQPQMADYVRTVRRKTTAWVPHYFQPGPVSCKPKKFTVGVLGGVGSPYKNVSGCIKVAKDFAANNPNTEIVISDPHGEVPHIFLERIKKCSVLLHTSHLECYPNLIQEAWSVGVPVVMSTASIGLYQNHLIGKKPWHGVHDLVVKSNNDASELYHMIDRVYADHNAHNRYGTAVHEGYKRLSQAAEDYTAKVLSAVRDGYQSKTYKGLSDLEIL